MCYRWGSNLKRLDDNWRDFHHPEKGHVNVLDELLIYVDKCICIQIPTNAVGCIFLLTGLAGLPALLELVVWTVFLKVRTHPPQPSRRHFHRQQRERNAPHTSRDIDCELPVPVRARARGRAQKDLAMIRILT